MCLCGSNKKFETEVQQDNGEIQCSHCGEGWLPIRRDTRVSCYDCGEQLDEVIGEWTKECIHCGN